MNILPGDVLVVWGDSLVEEGIELVTHGPSHVALFHDESNLSEAQGGRTVSMTSLNNYLTTPGTRLEVWGDPDLTYDQRNKVSEYYEKSKGTPYDYSLIGLEALKFELHIDIDWFKENGHLICSTYVNGYGAYVGKHWSVDPLAAPADLLMGGVLIRKEVLK